MPTIFRLSLGYYRNTKPDRVNWSSLDIYSAEVRTTLPASVISQMAQGLQYLLMNFQVVDRYRLSIMKPAVERYKYPLIGGQQYYNTWKSTPVSQTLLPAPLTGLIATYAGGERLPLNVGIFIRQSDYSGRKAGRMVVKGGITESMNSQHVDANSWPISAMHALGLATVTAFSPTIGLWGAYMVSDSLPYYICNLHGGDRAKYASTYSRVTGMLIERCKQYRGVRSAAD